MHAALVYDTETSDLWQNDLPWDHASQPHLVELSAALFSPAGVRTQIMTMIVRPDGWTVTVEAQAHHHISSREASMYGLPLRAVLVAFQALTKVAFRIVAHNQEYDRAIIQSAIARAGGEGTWWQKRARDFYCTMETAVYQCDLPGKFGRPKFPSLDEAHNFYFPEAPFRSPHRAEADMLATARVYFAQVAKEAANGSQARRA